MAVMHDQVAAARIHGLELRVDVLEQALAQLLAALDAPDSLSSDRGLGRSMQAMEQARRVLLEQNRARNMERLRQPLR